MLLHSQTLRLPTHQAFLEELRFDRSEIASFGPSSIKSDSTGYFLNFDRVCTPKRGVWCPAPVLIAAIMLAMLSFIVSNASVYYISVNSCGYDNTNNLANRKHPTRLTPFSDAELSTSDLDKWNIKSPIKTLQPPPKVHSQVGAEGKQHKKNDYDSKTNGQLIDLGPPDETTFFQVSSKPMSAAAHYPGPVVEGTDDPARVRLNIVDSPTATVAQTTTASTTSTTSTTTTSTTTIPLTTTGRHSQILNRIFDLPDSHSGVSGGPVRPEGVFTISTDIEPIASGNKWADTKFDLVNFVFYKRTEDPTLLTETSNLDSPPLPTEISNLDDPPLPTETSSFDGSPLPTETSSLDETTTRISAPISLSSQTLPLQPPPVIIVTSNLAWQDE